MLGKGGALCADGGNFHMAELGEGGVGGGMRQMELAATG